MRIYPLYGERKKDHVLNILFLIMYALTISLIDIDASFLSLIPQENSYPSPRSYEK